MKADLYSKTVLTVIAACLAWLCMTSRMPVAAAQSDTAQRVVIVGLEKPLVGLPVLLVSTTGSPVVDREGARVVIANGAAQPVPVGIASIGQAAGNAPWQPIHVEVLQSPGTQYPGR